MNPLAVGVKAYVIYFSFRRELVVFCESCEKFSRPDLWDSEIVI